MYRAVAAAVDKRWIWVGKTIGNSVLVKNRVVLTLWLLMMLALWQMPLLTQAANRLVSGTGMPLRDIIHGFAWILILPFPVLLILCFCPQNRLALWLIYLVSGALFAGLLLLIAWQAHLLAGDEDSLVRVSLGGGFWFIGALSLLSGADAVSRLTQSSGIRILAALLILAPIPILLLSGALDTLSLMKEYANRDDVFNQALGQHLTLLFSTLAAAVLIGVPLGIVAARCEKLRKPMFSVLNIIQTIPSIALFGLLIAPLAGLAQSWPWLGTLGISGIGVAPALIALVLYALLPLVRSVVAGIEQVPQPVIEAARGVGMTQSQILRKVELPLALPVVLSGVRIVAVQTVGMAVIAGLIGAGGFGAIVFQGLLSSALDLVLLGVIPVVVMAVTVDTLFKFLVSRIEATRQ